MHADGSSCLQPEKTHELDTPEGAGRPKSNKTRVAERFFCLTVTNRRNLLYHIKLLLNNPVLQKL